MGNLEPISYLRADSALDGMYKGVGGITFLFAISSTVPPL